MHAAEDDPELVALAQKLGAAIARSDAAQAQAQFTPTAWSSIADSGERLYKQGTRKHFELRLFATQRQGERAVLSVDVSAAGRLVDRVYLYAVRQSGHWLVEGLDENRGHHEPFLAGQVPAAFRVEELPNSAELMGLGAQIIDAANAKPGAVDKLYKQVVDTSSTGYLELAELRGAACKAAYFSAPLGKVALVFEKPSAPNAGADAGAAAPERIVLYLQRQQSLWHVYARSYGAPSARQLLPETRFYLKAPSDAK